MKKLSYRTIGILVLLGVTLIWGATFTLTKNALSDVDPYSFLAVRFTIAALCLIFISVCSKKTRLSFTKQTWIAGTLLGILLFSGYIFQTVGLNYTTPAKAGFLTGLSVVLVPIFAPLITRQRMRLHIAISAFMAVIGLILLCGIDIHHFAKGDILVLICSIFIALQILYTEKWGGKLDSLALSTVEIGVISVLATGTVFLHLQYIKNVSIWFRPNVLAAILVCAVLATSFAYYAQTLFQKAITSAQAAIIFSMEPVFAALISVLFNGEILNTAGWAGSILIFASMLTADENLVKRRISLRSAFRR